MGHGIQTQVDELRHAAMKLDEVAGVAGKAQQDMLVYPGQAFGTTLGMGAIATAYSDHLNKVWQLMGQLHDNVEDTATSFRSIANVYDDTDEGNRKLLMDVDGGGA
jgi:hypothetical protein